VTQLFKSLDRLEESLSKCSTPYLLSSPHVTEADIRLFTTIIRFDPVYVQHFKCNIRDIRSGYPLLHQWMRHLYWVRSRLLHLLLQIRLHVVDHGCYTNMTETGLPRLQRNHRL
jgi:glutathionyl-hydroquinone reductase